MKMAIWNRFWLISTLRHNFSVIKILQGECLLYELQSHNWSSFTGSHHDTVFEIYDTIYDEKSDNTATKLYDSKDMCQLLPHYK